MPPVTGTATPSAGTSEGGGPPPAIVEIVYGCASRADPLNNHMAALTVEAWRAAPREIRFALIPILRSSADRYFFNAKLYSEFPAATDTYCLSSTA